MYRNVVCKSLEEFKKNIAMISYTNLVSEDEYDRVVDLVWSFFLEVMTYCPEGSFVGEEKYYTSQVDLFKESTYPLMYYTDRRITFKTGPQSFIELGQDGCKLVYSDIYIGIDDLYKIYSCSKKILSYVKTLYKDYENSVAEKNMLLREEDTNKSASTYFEELYHNTGRTLGEVLDIMKTEKYSYKETVDAICKVLKDAQWND